MSKVTNSLRNNEFVQTAILGIMHCSVDRNIKKQRHPDKVKKRARVKLSGSKGIFVVAG